MLVQVFGRTAFEACSIWFRSMVITSEHVEDSKPSSVLKFRYSLTLSCMHALRLLLLLQAQHDWHALRLLLLLPA